MNNPWRAAGWVLLGASLILALSLGIRHGFGLFLSPMSGEYGWGREVFAFAIALQNLIWGLAQPITGAVADRFGARRVIIGGGGNPGGIRAGDGIEDNRRPFQILRGVKRSLERWCAGGDNQRHAMPRALGVEGVHIKEA